MGIISSLNANIILVQDCNGVNLVKTIDILKIFSNSLKFWFSPF